MDSLGFTTSPTVARAIISLLLVRDETDCDCFGGEGFEGRYSKRDV